MVVALRALHGHAQEDLRRLGRGLHAALRHLVGQEIGRPVEILVARPAAAGGRDQLLGQLVVRLVVLERLAADTAACRRDRPASGAPCRPCGRSGVLVQIVVQLRAYSSLYSSPSSRSTSCSRLSRLRSARYAFSSSTVGTRPMRSRYTRRHHSPSVAAFDGTSSWSAPALADRVVDQRDFGIAEVVDLLARATLRQRLASKLRPQSPASPHRGRAAAHQLGRSERERSSSQQTACADLRVPLACSANADMHASPCAKCSCIAVTTACSAVRSRRRPSIAVPIDKICGTIIDPPYSNPAQPRKARLTSEISEPTKVQHSSSERGVHRSESPIVYDSWSAASLCLRAFVSQIPGSKKSSKIFFEPPVRRFAEAQNSD